MPPQRIVSPSNSTMLGSRRSKRDRFVGGPRPRNVTSRGCARIVSHMTFSAACALWRGTAGRWRPPNPSGPCIVADRSGRIVFSNAMPIRGVRGGSRYAIIACKLFEACSEETFPPVAVTARTSKRGSNNAIARAIASSIPGSTSIITFFAMSA